MDNSKEEWEKIEKEEREAQNREYYQDMKDGRFDGWLSECIDDLRKEFIEENYPDEFDEWCKNVFKASE
jgi:hypothetical protein